MNATETELLNALKKIRDALTGCFGLDAAEGESITEARDAAVRAIAKAEAR